MTDLAQETVDGAMLIGFDAYGDTFATEVTDAMLAQELYYYLGDISEYRSVDNEGPYIVSWRPKPEIAQRVSEWRHRGLFVPDDLSLSNDTVSLLGRLCASERTFDKGEHRLELDLPPLSARGTQIVRATLLTEHNILAEKGLGIEPFIISGEYYDTMMELMDKRVGEMPNE